MNNHMANNNLAISEKENNIKYMRKLINFHENMKDREFCTNKEYMIFMLLALLFMKIWKKKCHNGKKNIKNS